MTYDQNSNQILHLALWTPLLRFKPYSKERCIKAKLCLKLVLKFSSYLRILVFVKQHVSYYSALTWDSSNPVAFRAQSQSAKTPPMTRTDLQPPPTQPARTPPGSAHPGHSTYPAMPPHWGQAWVSCRRRRCRSPWAPSPSSSSSCPPSPGPG